MKPHQVACAAAVLCWLGGRAAALSLPSVFGLGLTRDSDDLTDVDVDEEALESLDREEKDPPHGHEPTKKPTRPPLLPAIPHPADHPLHPHNDPSHPLHPDNLPHLPPLPPLPPLPALPDLHRETIHATKTVYVVATEKVTIHPVCMKAGPHTPPCLPYDPHHLHPLQPLYHHHHHHHHGWKGEGEGDKVTVEEAISPSRAADALQTSAVAELEQPVLLVDGESESEVEAEVEAGGEGAARDARYVELTPALSAAPDHLEIKDEPQEEEAAAGGGGGGGALSRPLGMVQDLINHYRPAVTLYKTKTVYLTKVDKVLDARVTATVVPHNCVPVNSHIPACGPAGAHAPGHHQHHGVYTEGLGGHVIAGHGKNEDEAKELPEPEEREEKEQVATDSE